MVTAAKNETWLSKLPCVLCEWEQECWYIFFLWRGMDDGLECIRSFSATVHLRRGIIFKRDHILSSGCPLSLHSSQDSSRIRCLSKKPIKHRRLNRLLTWNLISHGICRSSHWRDAQISSCTHCSCRKDSMPSTAAPPAAALWLRYLLGRDARHGPPPNNYYFIPIFHSVNVLCVKRCFISFVFDIWI